MPIDAKNIVRSVLGQGLAMGWGDEAEAWLRSKLGDEEYEQALQKIRGEYGTFAEESPWISGVGEFTGGAIPAVAGMLVPGGQLASVGALSRLAGAGRNIAQRTLKQNIVRSAALGSTQGAITGAGSAEGDRTSGAVGGGIVGGTVGAAVPLAGSAIRSTTDTIRNISGVSPEKAREWALNKLNMALDGESPRVIAARVRQDIQSGVPPTIANVTPGTMQLAESVVQRGGEPSRELERIIAENQAGSRTRVGKQVRRALKAKDFYQQESELAEELRRNADTLYDEAYKVGDVADPAIFRVLQDPEFKEFYDRGKAILGRRRLAAELDPQGDPSKFTLKPIYDPQTGQMVEVPDVQTLDYIKQGIDAKIEELKGKDRIALKELRKVFVDRIDDLVPEYKIARREYAGDMEILDALRMGREEFNKLDPEQVQAFMKTASKGEQDAFRTGVARNLYDQIMDPSTNIDAARRIIGSPSTRKAIEAVIETPAARDLFIRALERETELFKAAGRILAGSQTAKRGAMREQLESRPGVAEAAAETLRGGWAGGMMQGVLSILRRQLPDEYYQELADLLATGRPGEVAAVVRMLEEAARVRAPKAARVTGTEAAISGGAIGLAPPAPASEEARAREREREALFR